MKRSAGAAFAIASALAFGASAPFSKLLLRDCHPLVLAGLLYLGGGMLLSAGWLASRGKVRREAPLRASDAPVLLGLFLFGGVLGPVLMLLGFARVSGVSGALLLNLETPATILIAALVLREHVNARVVASAALVVSGAALLGWSPGELKGDWLGVGLLAAASCGWAIDNALSRLVADRNPFAVGAIKSLGAGTLNLAIAYAFGAHLPATGPAAGALALGSASYGLSYLFYLLGVRSHGSARQAAYFATSPFLGALLAVPVLGETLSAYQLAALALMAGGVSLLLFESHAHRHTHPAVEHEHAHVHDDGHHDHPHDALEPAGEPHSHLHRHAERTHEHAHAPDLHHRHQH